MKRKVEIGTDGIKKLLRNISINKAITEYIWNGIDAGADKIEVTVDFKAGILKRLLIKDNGTGIDYNFLKNKFIPFHESEKINLKNDNQNHSSPHGKKGIGRLTFHKFSHRAKWTTIYESGNKHLQYNILMNEKDLNEYETSPELPIETKDQAGTVVEFDGLYRDLHNAEVVDGIIKYIKLEFAWYLELFKDIKIIFLAISAIVTSILGGIYGFE